MRNPRLLDRSWSDLTTAGLGSLWGARFASYNNETHWDEFLIGACKHVQTEQLYLSSGAKLYDR